MVPKVHWTTALNGCHQDIGHQGCDCTLSLLQEHFWKPGMAKQIRQIIWACTHYLQYEGGFSKAPLCPIVTRAPLDLLHVAFTSIETMLEPNNHLELPTSWCSKTTSQSTCWHTWPLIKLQKLLLNSYMEGYISIFGTPARLLGDRGANFTSSIIEEMCKILGIKWLWTMPYHPQMNGLVERLHQTTMHMIGKLGEDKKADWPSHLAEIAHAYNATQFTVTGYRPHYLMFGWWPRLPVVFIFPTIGSNEAPMRETSISHVDEYVASVCDRLRTVLWETQAQSMAEVHWQKWYYNRKISVVNLKPGNLILVKVDAFKGRREIWDRWKEETWEVVHQIMTDTPSYKVTNQYGKPQVLHWNQLLLIASEVGVPSCLSSRHTWDRCTSLTPCKKTSTRGEWKRMPQENNGKVVTQWPTSKASLGWINGKLRLLPWMFIRASTDNGWRPQVMWCGCRPWKEHVHKAEGAMLEPIDAGR